MAESIIRYDHPNHPAYQEIQLDATSANTDAEIKAEIAAYEASYPCSKGSKAYSFNYDVFYKKKNDNTWASIL
jgi:hypothetical protein